MTQHAPTLTGMVAPGVLSGDRTKVFMRQGAGKLHFMLAIAVSLVAQGVRSINDSKNTSRPSKR